MSDEDALLEAIAAHPDEDTPRLAYADWLDEHDRHVRAEFIRLQIDIDRKQATLPRRLLDRHVDLFRRQQDLIDNDLDVLLGPLAALHFVDLPVFRRGFVSEIQLPVWEFLAHAPLLAAVRPAPAVGVVEVAARLSDFVRSEHLGCVTHISGWSDAVFERPPVWPGGQEVLDAADRLTRLRSLDLENCALGDTFCDLLGNFSLPALADLDLSNNRITDAGVVDLLTTHFPRQLLRLVLGGNPIGDDGAIALAEQWPTGAADKLEKLNLRFTDIGQPGHQALTARFGGRVDLF